MHMACFLITRFFLCFFFCVCFLCFGNFDSLQFIVMGSAIFLEKSIKSNTKVLGAMVVKPFSVPLIFVAVNFQMK